MAKSVLGVEACRRRCRAAPTRRCESRLATARSGLPSPFEVRRPSPSTGLAPVVKSVFARRSCRSPLPSSTDTLLELWLATARSGLPSPLKSALVTETGVRAGGEVGLGAEACRRRCRAAPTRCSSRRWRPRGRVAVAVEVRAGHDGGWRRSRSRSWRRSRRARLPSSTDTVSESGLRRRGRVAVGVEVGARHRAGLAPAVKSVLAPNVTAASARCTPRKPITPSAAAQHEQHPRGRAGTSERRTGTGGSKHGLASDSAEAGKATRINARCPS